MTVVEIVAKIKELAHDGVLKTPLVYSFISQVLNEIENRYNLAYMRVLDESVAVSSGTSLINTSYKIKQIISINYDNSLLTIDGSGLRFKDAVDSDTDVTISYYRYSPEFDGADANYIFPNDWVIIYGAVYLAMIFNMSPEASVYKNMYEYALRQMYNSDMQRIGFEWKCSDALGL